MEIKIIIIQPWIVWATTIETIGEMVAAQTHIYIKVNDETIAHANMDSYWPSVADWERQVRRDLYQIINGNDVIVESRITIPRYSTTETERRVQEVINQILGIPGR